MAVVAGRDAGVAAARRGATILQLRDHRVGAAALELEATRLVAGVQLPVVVSDRVDVALAASAAGAHLPGWGLPVAAARQLLPGALLGRSVHSRAEAVAAAAAGADYLVFGPVFVTASHPGAEPAGLEALAAVCAAVPVPVLAIGGIDWDRAGQCRAAGAAGFAAVGLFRS